MRPFTADGLVGGRCAACHRRHFPVATWCPWCGDEGPSEVQLSPRGVLWSWTSVTSPPPGYVGPVPFGFGVVELPADGLRIVTRLTEADPTRLHEGQGMVFTVIALSPETATWGFAPLYALSKAASPPSTATSKPSESASGSAGGSTFDREGRNDP